MAEAPSINVIFFFSQVDQIKMMPNATHQEYIILLSCFFFACLSTFQLGGRLEVMTEKLD